MVTSLLQAVNISSCVNIVSSWAKFEFCWCYSYSESNTNFRLLQCWTTVTLSLVGGLECRRVFIVFLIYAWFSFHTAHLGPRALCSFLFPSSGLLLLVMRGKLLGSRGVGAGGMCIGILPSSTASVLVRSCMPELQERAFLRAPVPLITVFKICSDESW